MTLVLEPKTTSDVGPMTAARAASQAAHYFFITPLEDDDLVDDAHDCLLAGSAVFDKHDAIARGEVPRPRPLEARELTYAERMLPALVPAAKPNLIARLRHALSWKG
jgi:hypothetical protein